MALRFLLTSWGNPGNLNPMLTAARRLRQRGHLLRIIGAPSDQAEISEAGFEFLPWHRPAPPAPPEFSGEDGIWAEVRYLMEHVVFGAALDYAADTMDALRAESADAVLTSDVLAGAVIAAEAAGIPCAMLEPHVSIRPLDDVPSCVSGLIPNGSPEYQAEEKAARARFTELMDSYLPMLNRARTAFGISRVRNIFDHFDRADRVLIGLSRAFNSPATRLPANLRYVGPLLDLPAWARPWTAPWSGRPVRPRVLVLLSTSFQNQGALLRRIIAALGRMDLDAVVTTGPAMGKEAFEAPPNVAIVHSAPHDTVMKEVTLVITHGGHGTVVRSLLNGVPLLVIPMGRDQGDNAARVVARDVGLTLAEGASEEEIAAAVGRLTAEPHFRVSAARLGQAIAPDVASLALVAEMDAIATRRWRHSA